MTPWIDSRKFRRLGFLAGLAAAVILCLYFFKANYEVPILMYHHVDAHPGKSGNIVTPETFERQMEFLKVHRYRVVSLTELVGRIKRSEPIDPKTVVLTFDDGNFDNIQHAFPVLKKMDFPATIFMITANINEPGSLSEEDLRILDASGIEIGSHTAYHAFLPRLESSKVRAELTESKKKLERILGHPVGLFSYPAGGLTAETQALVRESGYEGAVTTNYGKARHDPYALHRIKASEAGGSLFNFWVKLSGVYHVGKKKVRVAG